MNSEAFKGRGARNCENIFYMFQVDRKSQTVSSEAFRGRGARGTVRLFFICFKLAGKVKLCLRGHLGEGGARNSEIIITVR